MSWMPPEKLSSPSLVYVVSYRQTDGSMESLTSGEDRLEVAISGLLPFMTYFVTVKACSSVGCGPVSMEVSAVTLQGGRFLGGEGNGEAVLFYQMSKNSLQTLTLDVILQRLTINNQKNSFLCHHFTNIK